LRQVDALLFLELGDDVVDDALVEVFAAQEGVAVGRQHFELHFAIDVGDLDDRDVEGAAAQVIHGDLAVALAVLVQAEGQGRGGGLVDDALDVQAGDAAGVLGGLALAVVEVRRHRDHGFGDPRRGSPRPSSSSCAALRRTLRRRQLLAAHFDPGVAVVGGGDL
jgi:GNAT superfamily N-acetyltransferase